jgi:hypothetical protein
MATYAELLLASEDAGLRNKVRVACIVAAEAIRTEDAGTANHAARLAWARSAFESPESVTQRMLWAVLAQNKAAALAAITGASDATVQTAVNAAVDVFAV